MLRFDAGTSMARLGVSAPVGSHRVIIGDIANPQGATSIPERIVGVHELRYEMQFGNPAMNYLRMKKVEMHSIVWRELAAVAVLMTALTSQSAHAGADVYGGQQDCWQVSPANGPFVGCEPTKQAAGNLGVSVLNAKNITWRDGCYVMQDVYDTWGLDNFCRGTRYTTGCGTGAVPVMSYCYVQNIGPVKRCPDFSSPVANKPEPSCQCQVGYRADSAAAKCVTAVEWNRDSAQVCSAPGYGNPVYPLTGAKRSEIDIGRWFGQSTQVGYDTRRKLPVSDPTVVFLSRSPLSFGSMWESSLHKHLVVQGPAAQSVQAARGMGKWVSFRKEVSGGYAAGADVDDRLQQLGSGWRYYDASARAIESYDVAGVLGAVDFANGRRLTFSYSGAGTPTNVAPYQGLLIGVGDGFGRLLQWVYERPIDTTLPARITRMIDPAARVTDFGYDVAGMLAQITWPDLATQKFKYEDLGLPWALTGIVDESEARSATYGYDAAGRANLTQAANGVNQYSVTWGAAPQWQITETYDTSGIVWLERSWVTPSGTVVTLPNGEASSLGATAVLGMPRLSSQSQPAGAGCAAASSSQDYDANGNVKRRDDFNGRRACMAHDLTRNLETQRVEGLATSADCDLTVAASTVPAGARRVSTRWHPSWRLQTDVAEPGRRTQYVYNGQTDPLTGTTLNCPGTGVTLPTLPDGSPLALLCKKIERATKDVDGAQGFAAAFDTAVPARVWSYSYNPYGQVLTEDGPRTDVADITTYTYYTDTAFTGTDPDAVGHTIGDLLSVTNALGKVTNYTNYDKAGQVLEMVDANGVVTSFTYDVRQRLRTATTGGQTTSYDYWPTGLLMKVTQPDGVSFVLYTYDDAHRLTRLEDQRGNSITYALDNMGNRIGEAVKDPGGLLRRQLSRSIDALGRVQQVTGRE